MLFKSTEIVNSVFEWIVFSFFLSELIVNRILIVFLNKIVYIFNYYHHYNYYYYYYYYSGWENSLRSLVLGYATLTQTHTRISRRSRFTSYTRMTKSAFTCLEFLRQNEAHSHLWFLLPLEACLTNANVTTVVSLSYWQWWNRIITPPLSHGLGLESRLPFWGLHWFAYEARVLRGELLQIYRRLI